MSSSSSDDSSKSSSDVGVPSAIVIYDRASAAVAVLWRGARGVRGLAARVTRTRVALALRCGAENSTSLELCERSLRARATLCSRLRLKSGSSTLDERFQITRLRQNAGARFYFLNRLQY